MVQLGSHSRLLPQPRVMENSVHTCMHKQSVFPIGRTDMAQISPLPTT